MKSKRSKYLLPQQAGRINAIWQDRTPILQTVITLTLARFVVAVLPFSIVARTLGSFHPSGRQIAEITANNPGLSPEETSNAGLDAQASEVERVVRTLNTVCRNIPWLGICLPKALAALFILRSKRIASQLHIGFLVGAQGRRGIPHAWLHVGTLRVTGYPEAKFCKEFGYYEKS